MKNPFRHLLLALSLGLVSIATGAAVPALDVTVSSADGKVAFKGKTNAGGTFSTDNLAPGNYVVQFNSNSPAVKGNQYALVIGAGKQKVTAQAVAGSKFAAGGVAMKLEVGKSMNITGQVSSGMSGSANGKAESNANVKIINGKRYVWVKGGETGSHLGGHWVEEGSPEARNVSRMSTDAVRQRQDHGDAHQEGFGGR